LSGIKKYNLHVSQLHPEQKLQEFTLKSSKLNSSIEEGTDSDVRMLGKYAFRTMVYTHVIRATIYL
jgi:hypothetical protein